METSSAISARPLSADWACAGRELRTRVGDLRSRTRLGAGHRGTRHSEPDSRVALGHSDAAAPREEDAANKIRHAIEVVYTEKKHLTRDMGGEASTSEFADAIIDGMEREINVELAKA